MSPLARWPSAVLATRAACAPGPHRRWDTPCLIRICACVSAAVPGNLHALEHGQDAASVAANFCDGLHVCLLQAARRILGSLPTSSQGVCLSPYLDARLFAYDEKLIAPDMRPRTYSEQALKFVSQAHPNACRFKVGSSSVVVASCNKMLP